MQVVKFYAVGQVAMIEVACAAVSQSQSLQPADAWKMEPATPSSQLQGLRFRELIPWSMCHLAVVVNTVLRSMLEPILVGIESDVRWGYDLGFDPWPFVRFVLDDFVCQRNVFGVCGYGDRRPWADHDSTNGGISLHCSL